MAANTSSGERPVLSPRILGPRILPVSYTHLDVYKRQGHLGISPNTVKQYISTALQKLNIKQRKDLKQYMLR